MTIFLSVIGTRGDLELFLMLGRELRRRGHQVVVGTSLFYQPLVLASNLQWVQLGNGTYEQMQIVLRTMAKCRDRQERTRIYYDGWFEPQMKQSIDTICRKALASDYFMSNTKLCLWQGEVALAGACVTYDVPASLDELANNESQQSQGRIIELVAMNKRLVDPGNGWKDVYRFTGFWLRPKEPAWAAPNGLLNFLSVGPSPVAVTLGSMQAGHGELLAVIRESLRLAGQRGVMLGNWGRDAKAAIAADDDFYFGTEIPYSWLFPQASCVIHHGGMGTVAEALAAGVSSILLPQIPAQQRIADLLLRESLAAGVLDSATTDCKALVTNVRAAVTDRRFAEHAAAWRKAIRGDRGVMMAVDLIEQHADQLGYPRPAPAALYSQAVISSAALP